jgi:hypothetical protein
MESSYRSDTDPQQDSSSDTPQDLGAAPSVPVPPAPLASPEDEKYARPGWSWGGFMFNFIFIIAIRRYWYLLLVLLALIPPLLVGLSSFSVPYHMIWIILLAPVLSFLIILGVMVFFGIKGRVLAAKSSTFANRDQYIGFMKGIDHAGKVLFFTYVVFALTTLTLTVLASFGGARNRAEEASMRQQEAMRLQMEQMLEQEVSAQQRPVFY